MKFWLLIIIPFFATNLIKNVESVGERGQEPKLYKTFDEIFGKGWDDESNDSKDLNCRHIKEEVQDGQAPNTSDQKNIDEILKQKFNEIYDENWSEDENNSAPDQAESVDEQQNKSNECGKIESDQHKREIIQKFREMKDDYRQKGHTKEWVQIEIKIANGLGVGRTKIYKWIKELGLRKEKKSKFSEIEKCKILKQFEMIKSKCKKANLKNILMNELDKKIAKKLGVCDRTIRDWKRKFGLYVNKKISDATKIGILKKYAKIKGNNPKMTDAVIADILNISSRCLSNWKKQFKDEIKNH